MIGALLLNNAIQQRKGGYPHRRTIWVEEKAEAQDELTRFKCLDEEEQLKIVEQAVNVIKAEETGTFIPEVSEAKELTQDFEIEKLITRIEYLNIVMLGYFMLCSNRKRRNIAAMLTLGVL